MLRGEPKMRRDQTPGIDSCEHCLSGGEAQSSGWEQTDEFFEL
jgi:hypothetical protein